MINNFTSPTSRGYQPEKEKKCSLDQRQNIIGLTRFHCWDTGICKMREARLAVNHSDTVRVGGCHISSNFGSRNCSVKTISWSKEQDTGVYVFQLMIY